MYIAMPLQGTSLASHFTKAQSYALFDQYGKIVKQLDNPALNQGCAGKNKLIELFNMHNVSQIVVKNIGERMLGKLIEAQIQVKQVNRRGRDPLSLFSQLTQFTPLTKAEHGRESVNYRAKQLAGGEACCHQDGNDHYGHTHNEQSSEGACCSNHDTEHKPCGQHKGRGRCCH